MSKYWDAGNFSQPTTAQLRKNSESSQRKAREKGQVMEPVVITGRTIVRSWWGRAWCNNLEQYADFESRLDRGKRYVRTGAVLDLKIQKGKVLAKVQGSRKTPYKVEIRISPLSEEKCQAILEKCGQRIQNLEALAEGNFPAELKELFTGQDGLFPTPKEISFNCSCPDWALMCKHVAAALYGIGTRLDDQPALFFQLRGIDIDRFLDVAVANKVEAMLEHAQAPSDRILDGADLEALFGVL